jgi:hypothetical protein
VPPWAAGITLHAHDPLNRADEDLARARHRAKHRGSAVREGDGHGGLLFTGVRALALCEGRLLRVIGHVNTYEHPTRHWL